MKRSYAHDEDQGVEVLRVGLLTQKTALRALADNMDRRFRAYDGLLDEIADRLDALVIGTNRNRNNDKRRPRDDIAQGQPVNGPVPAHHHR